MDLTNIALLLLGLVILCSILNAMNSSPTEGGQMGGAFYSWIPSNWYTYPATTYVDGNSYGWYNNGGWFGQTRPRYRYRRGYGRRYWVR